MNELFPIIRRKRRPFLVEDAPPVVAGGVKPVGVEAGANVSADDGSRGGLPHLAESNQDDEKVSASSESR